MLLRTLAGAGALLILALVSFGARGAESGGGPVSYDVTDDAEAEISLVLPAAKQRAAELGLPVTAFAGPASLAGFQFPLQPTEKALGFRSEAVTNYVDHDTTSGVRDFMCTGETYDGHSGTDLALWPFAWSMMDRKEMRVVAALPGTIIAKADGNFDRQCTSTGSPPANYVIIRHDNGLLGLYWHLKKGSVTGKAVGAHVATGEILGLVGSSGRSTAPHLHFELQDDAGTVDPYAGRCNPIATEWTHQPPGVNPEVMLVATHSRAPPNPSSGCGNPNPGYATLFQPGATVFGAVYLAFQTAGANAVIAFVRPDGSIAASWRSGSPATGYWNFAYWYASTTLPSNAPLGEWKLRVTFLGKAYEQSFWVGPNSPSISATKVSLSVKPPAATVRPGHAATFTVTLSNLGTRRAYGCRLSLTRPIAADVTFRLVNAAGKPLLAANRSFPIGAGGAKRVALTIVPKATFAADQAEFGVIAKCTNSPSSSFSRTTTMLTLTR